LSRRELVLQEGIMSAAKHRSKEKARGATRFLRKLGPGLITGASDDDPSGIGTYSQAGAQLGFGIGWTMVLTYPLMAAIQEISARLGRVTGHGIAGNICRHYPGWLLHSVVALLFVANSINIGADLGAMADATKLMIGGPAALYVIAFGAFCALAEIFLNYRRYVAFLKWLTLVLFAYVGALAFVEVPWGEALRGLFIPRIVWSNEFLTTLVALLGTTISPYLFFWQAAQEAEDERVQRDAKPLVRAPQQASKEFERIRLDTLVGMAFSNLIAIAIIITTAATLHQRGITEVQTSAQAAEALKPIAGDFASLIFTLGIVGTGLLAVPVLAGSAAYGIGEGRRWPVGLALKPKRAKAFYAVIAIATALGVAMNFMPIDPIKALYWSAVINGVVAVPVMIVMMLMSARRKIMGRFVITGPLAWLGWLTTAAMAACVAGMAISWMT
jgi:NRAMP (natural resistance-associated macrophage protein)-like metal ion transporter